MQLPHNWARSTPKLVFLPRWVLHAVPVSEFVKDLGVYVDNALSQSAQCIGAANKARRDTTLLPRSFEIGFHSIAWHSGAFTRKWHASLFTKPCSRNQPCGANSKLAAMLVTGLHHPFFKKKLQRQRVWADLTVKFEAFAVTLDVEEDVARGGNLLF